jgi:hypothetical protein
MGGFGLKNTPGVVSKNPALNPRAAYLTGNSTTSNFRSSSKDNNRLPLINASLPPLGFHKQNSF